LEDKLMTELEELYLALETCTDDDEHREYLESQISECIIESWEWLRELQVREALAMEEP
jgi:hypothetical protein